MVDIERNGRAFDPSLERVIWYQNPFQLERGRECLALHRRALCRLLWQEWSPGWAFNDETFERTAASFDNSDFVDVVIHCYRFHFGATKGDPALEALEERLARKPRIGVPTITLDGMRDPLKPEGPPVSPPVSECVSGVHSAAFWATAAAYSLGVIQPSDV